jgi:hypothetical protein
MDDPNFCSACGKNLSSGDVFCPSCGMHMGDAEGGRKDTIADEKVSGDRIAIAVILLLISAVVSVLSGLYLYLTMDAFTDWIMSFFSGMDTMDGFMDYLINIMKISALLTVAAGAVAVFSALLAHKRRLWVFTIVTCIIVVVFGNFILGLIALYLLYKARSAFKD